MQHASCQDIQERAAALADVAQPPGMSLAAEQQAEQALEAALGEVELHNPQRSAADTNKAAASGRGVADSAMHVAHDAGQQAAGQSDSALQAAAQHSSQDADAVMQYADVAQEAAAASNAQDTSACDAESGWLPKPAWQAAQKAVHEALLALLPADGFGGGKRGTKGMPPGAVIP